MSANQFNDPRALSRYLDGQFSDAERESFEAHWVENPDLIQQLEADARLQAGLAHLKRTGRLERPARRWPALLAAAGIAAAAFLAIAIALQITNRSTMAPMILAASAEAFGDEKRIEPALEIVHTRSERYDATLQQPGRSAIFELRLLPDIASTKARYQMRLLSREAGGTRKRLATVDGLQPAKDGFVTVFVDAQRLTPGVYELLLVEGDQTDRSVQVSPYVVNVVPPARR